MYTYKKGDKIRVGDCRSNLPEYQNVNNKIFTVRDDRYDHITTEEEYNTGGVKSYYCFYNDEIELYKKDMQLEFEFMLE